MTSVYLDHNATTPVDPRVLEAALPYLGEHFGNPSSTHAYGRRPREAVAAGRAQVAALIGAEPEEIVFTGGGSEADTLAVRGLVPGGGQVVTQPTEHPAILEACRGYDVVSLPVDGLGRVAPSALDAALTGRTALVSIAHANSETGTLQPIADLAAAARRRGVPFHTDAAQTVGKVPVDVRRLGVDLLTVVGHKFYAPKGVGALYVRSGLRLRPLVVGGGQEGGLRAGTENVAFIAALGMAAEIARTELAADMARLAELRDLLHRELDALVPGGVLLNGDPAHRLPGTLNVSFPGVRSRELLAAIPELAASTGSACHEGVDAPSAVLTAMGLPDERARSAVRLSLGRSTTEADVRHAARLLATQVAAMRRP
ncbi:cysteine desulfurase family protein [Nonomuraea wenchangensis]